MKLSFITRKILEFVESKEYLKFVTWIFNFEKNVERKKIKIHVDSEKFIYLFLTERENGLFDNVLDNFFYHFVSNFLELLCKLNF